METFVVISILPSLHTASLSHSLPDFGLALFLFLCRDSSF
jgi:hypothetical protein